MNVDAFQNEEESIFNEMEDLNFRGDQPLRDRTREGSQYRKFNRKGFIVGGGIGAGYLRNQAGGLLFGTTNRATFLTDFKIGYAPTNALELYYVNKVSWWGESGTTVIIGLSSLGFSVYTDNRTATGLYLTGGAGLSTVDAPFESVDASYGFGLFGGIGYEFAEHVSFQTDLLYSHITDFGVELDSFAIRLMITVLAY
ncbi:hypothetical protein GWO43_00030 [candidate division KSB1 bacterium]|nr:hypothetical protein [candidate division KSB1 bacterium]NIR68392.1 hypothetical protein [candidate division KSB1 bacterium]NIS22466.1 hypothetical protein [candidate division KSB1 bacterium]NIT69314.1 hypothetical protein [candidate division KSB1 bacterium]NIU22971.1 hypothetical protein [candidate division KSB1 bacterium]